MQFFVAKFNLGIKEVKKIFVGLSLKLKKEKKKKNYSRTVKFGPH